ncbi:MAG TPA: site-2 protease family protein [Pirellulaceae bacterium]
MADEPTVGTWLGLKLLAWFGVAAGLTFVIFVHELGHFLVAKACGVKCEKFYVGFDFLEFKIPFTSWKIPRSLFKFQYGETEYGLGSLPLGGYVKMLGQDDDPRNAEHESARIKAAAPNADQARVEAIASGTAAEGFVGGQSVEKLTNEALAHPRPDGSTREEAAVPAKTTEGKTILLDPRSYPAKPVPARMAIISAGVIMNLIFAVILAAIAYCLGIEEMPAIVGSTSPGGSAWSLGIEPGSKIIQIGKSGKPYEALRWNDIRIAAMLNSGQEVPLFVRCPNGEEKWYDVRPVKNAKTKMSLVGIGPPQTTEIEIFPETAAHLNPKTSIPLRDFDQIIEADGQKLMGGADLLAVCAQKPFGPLNVKVERRERTPDGKVVEKPAKAPEVFETAVQPRPMRELGLNMKISPISAIRAGSPAAKAGLQIGDVVVEINGRPVGDPLSLSQRLTPQSGDPEQVTIVVEQKEKEQGQPVRRTVSVTPQQPLQSPTHLPTSSTSIESIGVAFDVGFEVADVVDGSPAASAGLAPGDVVTQAQFVCDDQAEGKKRSKIARFNFVDAIVLGRDEAPWATVIYGLQRAYPDMKIRLTWTRGKESISAELLSRDSSEFFDDTRGLELYGDVQTRIATDWKDAFFLGFRETKDQLLQVVTILHRLVTGRIPMTSISGPGGIIAVAATVASQGAAPLLMFLTMLSANLAVINFLPIPALDGGHMLFLSAEAVRGKPVDERLQMRLTVVGVICLLSLMVFATMMDVGRFIRWFS